MSVSGYRELKVWQKAMQFAKDIYVLSETLPKTETYGLSAQIRRAAVSIPSNIAEGHNRESLKEYLQFLSVAQGSLAELETQISLARLMDFIAEMDETRMLKKSDEIGRMLSGLQSKLKEKIAPRTPHLVPRT